MQWITTPAHRRWLEAEFDRVLEFARASRVDNGFGWLSNTGTILEDQGTHLWITGRMIHCFAAGAAMGRPGSRSMAAHGVRALLDGPLRDRDHGGWFATVSNSSASILSPVKEAYAHMFALLGAASATAAGIERAPELLAQAIDVTERFFYSDDDHMLVDNWDATFTRCDPYRGGNANMHAVEAFLVVHDVTDDTMWLDRCLHIADYLIHQVARPASYRVNEHFDENWQPIRDYNRDAPGDRFRAYGGTVGHWVEWARLLLHLRASLLAKNRECPSWLLEDATGLFAAGIRDGWAVDGAPGLVYTVDWDGSPVIRSRIRWGVVEAIGAASALWQVTADPQYSRIYEVFWDYCRDFLIDYEGGSWHQELDEHNTVHSQVWNGKQDIYHLLHCLLTPRLPLTPGLVPALSAGLLDEAGRGALDNDKGGTP